VHPLPAISAQRRTASGQYRGDLCHRLRVLIRFIGAIDYSRADKARSWDRDKDHGNYDTLNTAPDMSDPSTLFPAEQWSGCPVRLLPHSYDWTGLKSLVDSMTPNGDTNQAIGIASAWQSLAQT
jgi:hypothetical protein